jgi:Predicted metal binding domain
MEDQNQLEFQVVDPQVSQEKYKAEVDLFKQHYAQYRKRGILLLDESFPEIKLAFCSVRIRPYPVLFAVSINFVNYDFQAPSISFIDAFSFSPILINQLPHQFPRKIGQVQNQMNLQPLVIAQADNKPFFCIPGVREYHQHPAHTGDNWLLHRGIGGEGTLSFLIEKLHQYGVAAINGFQGPAIAQATVTFDLQSIPI